ncbi:MAG TPA: hypothetical protein VFE05_01260 [Longimicrobiaceae bacterium]|jgi:hypothetical protein|nr:hypothetical protein [Longimicrobiaceae bacterium]
MRQYRLDTNELEVTSFDVSYIAISQAITVIVSDPNTWEDTCINMCPTDDTCTKLGCTRTA